MSAHAGVFQMTQNFTEHIIWSVENATDRDNVSNKKQRWSFKRVQTKMHDNLWNVS